MKKCTGNNMYEWGFDAIFDVECPNCGSFLEFFKDEIIRKCSGCGNKVVTNRKDKGCNQRCSSSSTHMRNLCSNYKRSKERFYGRI
jgi:hypothetical protein